MAKALSRLEQAFLIGVEGVTEVCLVRHGEAEPSPGAGADPSLSPRGEEQALRLSQRLTNRHIDAVSSSPLRRARQTAQALSPAARSDARLVEAQVRVRGGRLEQLEPAAEVVARMEAAVVEAVAAHPGGQIVVVTHGLAILHYLEHVLELEPGGFRFFPQCASISVVRFRGSRRMVGPLGDVAHLEGVGR
ncbi:MAG: histidine phosphatase family protein [Candidatus Dormibacteria bacterium]